MYTCMCFQRSSKEKVREDLLSLGRIYMAPRHLGRPQSQHDVAKCVFLLRIFSCFAHAKRTEFDFPPHSQSFLRTDKMSAGTNKDIIPDFKRFCANLKEIFDKVRLELYLNLALTKQFFRFLSPVPVCGPGRAVAHFGGAFHPLRGIQRRMALLLS